MAWLLPPSMRSSPTQPPAPPVRDALVRCCRPWASQGRGGHHAAVRDKSHRAPFQIPRTPCAGHSTTRLFTHCRRNRSNNAIKVLRLLSEESRCNTFIPFFRHNGFQYRQLCLQVASQMLRQFPRKSPFRVLSRCLQISIDVVIAYCQGRHHDWPWSGNGCCCAFGAAALGTGGGVTFAGFCSFVLSIDSASLVSSMQNSPLRAYFLA